MITRTIAAQKGAIGKTATTVSRAGAPRAEPRTLAMCRFRVGPFRFVINAAAVADGDIENPRALAIAAAVLVPPRYRVHLERAPAILGPDTLALKGGRMLIRECLREGVVEIAPETITTRGMRPDSPWILGSLGAPPCFVLDGDALHLHFGRRGGSAP